MSYDPVVDYSMYNLLLEMLLEQGTVCKPRGKKIMELLGITVIGPLRENILVHPVRDINYRFMVAEWCWIMAGRNDLETLLKFNKNYASYSDDGKTLNGAYGPRIRSQLNYVLTKLREDRDSRQAIINLWTNNPAPSKDIPCTLNMQFFIREHHLNMIVNMRSSDAWLGLPYDWFTFTQLGNCIAGELGVNCGFLQLNLGSSHIYEEHWELGREIAEGDDVLLEVLKSPELPYLPEPTVFDWMLEKTLFSSTHDQIWRKYQQALNSPNKAEAKEMLRALVHP